MHRRNDGSRKHSASTQRKDVYRSVQKAKSESIEEGKCANAKIWGSQIFGHIVQNILHADLPCGRLASFTQPIEVDRENASCRAMCINGYLDLDSGSTKWEGASNR